MKTLLYSGKVRCKVFSFRCCQKTYPSGGTGGLNVRPHEVGNSSSLSSEELDCTSSMMEGSSFLRLCQVHHLHAAASMSHLGLWHEPPTPGGVRSETTFPDCSENLLKFQQGLCSCVTTVSVKHLEIHQRGMPTATLFQHQRQTLQRKKASLLSCCELKPFCVPAGPFVQTALF